MSDAIGARYDALACAPGELGCGRPVDVARLEPGATCIDLGCGRGSELLRMAQAVGPAGHAWGVDASPRMIEEASRRAAEAGLAQISFVCCDFSRIELPSETADWLFSNCALNHAADKLATWREICRLLKPGGRFSVSDIYALEPIDPRHRSDPEAVAQCWAGAVTRDEYLAQIQAAGLVDVEIARESAPYVRGAAHLVSFTVTGERPAEPV
jgi:SAM-dependent methyltransferase